MICKGEKTMKKKRIIFWVVIAFFFGAFFLREQYTLYKLGKVQKLYEEKLANIKSQNEQLLNAVKLTKRADYIENLAREKLKLIKPGEILILDKDKKK